MSFDSATFHSDSFKACWYVVIAQTPHVKPVFQSRYRTIVLKWSSIPHTLERWHFVEAGTASRLQSETRIGTYRCPENVIPPPVIFGYFDSVDGYERVVGVERWCVTDSTSFPLENFLAA